MFEFCDFAYKDYGKFENLFNILLGGCRVLFVSCCFFTGVCLMFLSFGSCFDMKPFFKEESLFRYERSFGIGVQPWDPSRPEGSRRELNPTSPLGLGCLANLICFQPLFPSPYPSPERPVLVFSAPAVFFPTKRVQFLVCLALHARSAS